MQCNASRVQHRRMCKDLKTRRHSIELDGSSELGKCHRAKGELGGVCTGFLAPHSRILGGENGAVLLGQRRHFLK